MSQTVGRLTRLVLAFYLLLELNCHLVESNILKGKHLRIASIDVISSSSFIAVSEFFINIYLITLKRLKQMKIIVTTVYVY